MARVGHWICKVAQSPSSLGKLIGWQPTLGPWPLPFVCNFKNTSPTLSHSSQQHSEDFKIKTRFFCSMNISQTRKELFIGYWCNTGKELYTLQSSFLGIRTVPTRGQASSCPSYQARHSTEISPEK